MKLLKDGIAEAIQAKLPMIMPIRTSLSLAIALAAGASATASLAGPSAPNHENAVATSPQDAKEFMRPVAGPLLFEPAVEIELAFTAKQRKMRDSNTIFASLTAAQKTRLVQIIMQLEGKRILSDPAVQSQLGLSSEQCSRLQEIEDSTMRQMTALRDPNTGQYSPESRDKLDSIFKTSEELTNAVLSSEQSSTLKRILGKPFDRTKIHGVAFGHSPGGKIGDPGENVLRPEPLKVTDGSLAPGFTAKTIDGKQVKLSDYKGKVVILDFWATWCGPCKASMPGMQKLKNQLKDSKVVFLWLCVFDDQPKFTKFAQENPQYKFKFLFDPAGSNEANRLKGIPFKYSVTGIPATFVIDQNGKVVFRGEGTDGNGPDVKLVKSLKNLGIKF